SAPRSRPACAGGEPAARVGTHAFRPLPNDRRSARQSSPPIEEAFMKAVVFHGVGDIRLDNVPEPRIQQPTDAIVRLRVSAICGTDLHMIRGTVSGMEPGTILGHEGVGIVEAVGKDVRNLRPGDVVIPSTISCGYCSYCRAGYYAQCDNANPNGPQAGTAFYGGPKQSGPRNREEGRKGHTALAQRWCG